MTSNFVTASKGIRYREHTSRRHGIRMDRYWVIRYRVDGKRREESLGWSSEGWNEHKARVVLTELQENIRLGTPPFSLKEKREMEVMKRAESDAERLKTEKASITFGEYFKTEYEPYSRANKRNPESVRTEETIFRHWIEPVIGERPLPEIAPIHLEKIKMEMAKAGKAPRTSRYALQIVQQVINHALNFGHFNGVNPVQKVKMPQKDNRRQRYLTTEEIRLLFDELKKTSPDTYDAALLSLNTGMRQGEIFALKWGDIDLSRGLINIKDAKNGKSRMAYINGTVREMLLSREIGGANDYVFPSNDGTKKKWLSPSFKRAVKKLKLNDGIEDKRYWACFHTLRHQCASILVEQGVDLYVVKEILGHQTIQMTERYSHLKPEKMSEAVRILDGQQGQPSAEVHPFQRAGNH